MDDFDYNADPIITIPVGTMLYTGGRLEDNSTCFRPFYYVGQRGKMNDGKKMYVGMSENEAEGYSTRNNDRGILKVFVVKKELHLRDVSVHFDFFEYEDAINFCQNADGYYIDWSYGSTKPPQVEIFLCDAPMFLEYVKCKKGINGEYSHECFPLCRDDDNTLQEFDNETSKIFQCISRSILDPKHLLSKTYYSKYKKWLKTV